MPAGLRWVALLGQACGYSAVDGRAVFGADTSQIEIVLFENESPEPNFELMIGDAVAELFEQRGPLVPVWNQPAAASDLVLRGVILHVSVRPIAFSSAGLARENRVELEVETDVRRAGSGDLLWSEQIRLRELYLASPDAQVSATYREQALRRLSSLLAERIYDGLFQTF